MKTPVPVPTSNTVEPGRISRQRRQTFQFGLVFLSGTVIPFSCHLIKIFPGHSVISKVDFLLHLLTFLLGENRVASPKMSEEITMMTAPLGALKQ